MNVESEQAVVNEEGQRIVHVEGRQALGRISLVAGGPVSKVFSPTEDIYGAMEVLVDEYILPIEPIVVCILIMSFLSIFSPIQ